MVPLLWIHRDANQDARLLGRFGPNGDFMWFEPFRGVQVTMDVVCQGFSRPDLVTTGPDR